MSTKLEAEQLNEILDNHSFNISQVNNLNNTLTQLQNELNGKVSTSTLSNISNQVDGLTSAMRTKVSSAEVSTMITNATTGLDERITVLENAGPPTVDLTDINNNISNLDSRLTIVEGKTDTLSTTVNDLSTEVSSISGEVESISTDLTQVNNDISSIQAAIEAGSAGSVITINNVIGLVDELNAKVTVGSIEW